MKLLSWNRVGVLGVSVLLGTISGCGENANDVGLFDDSPSSGGMGGSTATGDGSNTNTSSSVSTNAGDTVTTSSGAGGSGQGESTTDGATMGTSVGGSGTDTTSSGGTGNTSTTTGSSDTSGGTATTEGSGGATTSSDTTGSETTGGGSGGTGGGDLCPAERPADDSDCEPNGLECTYAGDCGKVTLVCTEGSWIRQPLEARTCASFTPETFPETGDSCACTPELRCRFLDCEGRGQLQAVCNGTTWEVQAQACETRPCGPETGEQPRCNADQICVAMQAGGPGVVYSCEHNPCAEVGLENSCECAQSICPNTDAYECAMHEDSTLLACTCTQCF